MRNNDLWWRNVNINLPEFCDSCGDDSQFTIAERLLFEIIQKELLEPSDFDRMDDPDFPEEKKALLKMLLNN